jgi:hypothetical protein
VCVNETKQEEQEGQEEQEACVYVYAKWGILVGVCVYVSMLIGCVFLYLGVQRGLAQVCLCECASVFAACICIWVCISAPMCGLMKFHHMQRLGERECVCVCMSHVCIFVHHACVMCV